MEAEELDHAVQEHAVHAVLVAELVQVHVAQVRAAHNTSTWRLIAATSMVKSAICAVIVQHSPTVAPDLDTPSFQSVQHYAARSCHATQ